jgi:hypothetical protein
MPMSLGLVRVLGWLVIAHGLSHAVLPLRGSVAPSVTIDDWIPIGLYAFGMIGFVTAGLGILGLKPLDRAISPLLVLASGLSLVAIVRFADPSLWFGAACDVLLFVTGLWRAYGGWPAHPHHGPRWHAAGVAAGFALLFYVAALSVMYPWHRTWGSTRSELLMALPGDAPHRDSALETQHAVTIDAPPEEVWPVLLQRVDDRRASLVEPQRALVLANRGAFVILPAPGTQTRFIIRSRVGDRELSVWESAVNFTTFELPHFVQERRMMLAIKRQAEDGRARRAAFD